MGINKALLSYGTVLIDLTGDTVAAAVLGKGYTAHNMAGEEVTGAATISENLSFSKVSVKATAWKSNSTYADYPYRAAISCTGATALHYPDVVFSDEDVGKGIFSPEAVSYSGGVYIYAAELPGVAMTIPTIYFSK